MKIASTLKTDAPASLVVFLVALPLCLGVALASGAPLFSGIIAGIVGGMVIGVLSKSPLSVSGPAAGLTVIVLGAIQSLPSYESFLVAVMLAGCLQIGFGFARLGVIGDFIPSSVIKGMLAAIGIILIPKQFPHALGIDSDYFGDEAMQQPDGYNTFTSLWHAMEAIAPGAMVISLVATGLIIGWEALQKKTRFVLIKTIPGALLAVASAVVLNRYFQQAMPEWALSGEHLVNVPISQNAAEFFGHFHAPDFGAISLPQVWKIAFTLAFVASLETLLSIEAIDKLDPQKRVTPTNRELKAQGVGNIVSGLLGGLPVTSVIVRSSANVGAGAQTRCSAVLHGVLLLGSVTLIPAWLNQIPLAALAAILILTGYKLAKPQILFAKYRKGMSHFYPYIITIIAILLTDLLIGIAIGFAVGSVFLMLQNYRSPLFYVEHENTRLLRARKDLFFIHKYELKQKLARVPDGSKLLIDLHRIHHIDLDNVEIIEDFMTNAKYRGITVELKYNAESRNQMSLGALLKESDAEE